LERGAYEPPLTRGSCSACSGATLPPRSPQLRGWGKQVKGPPVKQVKRGPPSEEQFPGLYGSAFEALPFIPLAPQALQPRHH